MSIDNYVELLAERKYEHTMGNETTRDMHVLQNEGCQVFLVDESTSLVYLILDGASDKASSSLESSKMSLEFKRTETFIVLLDFYDSFLDKVDYF